MTEILQALPTRNLDVDYTALARLQRGLDGVDSAMAAVATNHGCTLSMYQLLLAVRVRRQAERVDIGMLANALGVRHPSAAEMVRKAVASGFVTLAADEYDARRVLVELTADGHRTVNAVASGHREELRRARAGFIAALNALQ